MLNDYLSHGKQLSNFSKVKCRCLLGSCNSTPIYILKLSFKFYFIDFLGFCTYVYFILNILSLISIFLLLCCLMYLYLSFCDQFSLLNMMIPSSIPLPENNKTSLFMAEQDSTFSSLIPLLLIP